MPKTAIVMNMFYTGLGIARSLGERNVPVIGLTSQRGIYGNFTRYAKTVFCPDSRTEPEALAEFLREMGRRRRDTAVLFPTRDHDLQFLECFRHELSPYYHLALPPSAALNAALDKYETYLWSQRAGIPAPKCWLVHNEADADRVSTEAPYPCVLKPVASHHWRRDQNWQLVGARKAIAVRSREELLAEYALIARANKQVLIQELVPGSDDALVIAACYMDRHSRWIAGFNTQKLLQAPEGFGTGCIVQTVERPDLFERTERLLRAMQFSGIAEVEYKWDASMRDYQLIEVNPRPWDQHRLGHSCGVDLIYIAYADCAGYSVPAVVRSAVQYKWIAEDTFITTALSLLWRRDPKLSSLFRLIRGKRIYAIWSAKDPLPAIAFFLTRFLKDLSRSIAGALWSKVKRRAFGGFTSQSSGLYRNSLEKEKSHG